MRGTEAGRAGNREGGRAGSREQGGSEGRDPSWFDQPSTRPSPSPAEVRPQNLERESHGVRERAFRRRPQDGRRCHSKYFVSVSLCHKRGPPPTLSSEIRQGGPARGKRVHTFRGWCAPVRSPKESRVFPETWNARQTRCEKKWAAARDGCKRRPQEILFSLADRGVCFAATFHRRATHQQWARASRSQVSLQPECMRRALQISAESPVASLSAHSLTASRAFGAVHPGFIVWLFFCGRRRKKWPKKLSGDPSTDVPDCPLRRARSPASEMGTGNSALAARN